MSIYISPTDDIDNAGVLFSHCLNYILLPPLCADNDANNTTLGSSIAISNSSIATLGSSIVTPESSIVTLLSPLDVSLLACATSATACVADFNDTIPKHNNPAPRCGKVEDGAHYWVDASGNILTLKFPAIILTTGTFSRLGPYFNLPTNGVCHSFP